VGRAGQCARMVYDVGDASGLRLSMRSIVGLNRLANVLSGCSPSVKLSGPSKTGNLTAPIVGDMWAALANVLEWSTTSAMQVGYACQCGQSSGENRIANVLGGCSPSVN